MILYFQFEDLSKIFSVSKLDTNGPRIKLIIIFFVIPPNSNVSSLEENVSRAISQNSMTP